MGTEDTFRGGVSSVGKESEAGYTLLAVIFLLFLLTLSLSLAAPRVAREIQRDRERETVQRGLQYRRAIQLYYRKFHAFPPSLDALVKTNNIRFLRKKYVDPTTGKAEWKPILFGQAKTQTLGFFGQPLAGAGSAGGSVLAGTGPSGGNSNATGSSSIFGSSSTSTFGSSSTSASSTDSSSGSTGTSTGSSGSSSTGSTFGSTSSTGSSSGGQTFGGAGIVGFAPMGTRQSILIWKKKTRYSEWEFVYDPLSDMKPVSNNTGSIGTSAASTSNAIGSSGSGTSTSGSTFGSSTTSTSSQ
ncbi:MAG: type II secretion system protein [Terracidiphilus sp.]|nr:type II secretion system protein [Terracidiphilus sp.]